MSTRNGSECGIYMGHGQIVHVAPLSDGRWQLRFSRDGAGDEAAPPIADIRCEAIDADGVVRALALAAGPVASTVTASGAPPGARRARIMVVHGDHFHTREGALADEPVEARTGPNGGALIALSAETAAEVKAVSASRWELTFLERGAPAKAPCPDDVAVEAIGPRAEDYQVRQLMVLPKDGSTLIATGKIGDAGHVRLIVKGSEPMARSVPVPKA